jgi:UDP-N-acetylmuramate-alanine ligase
VTSADLADRVRSRGLDVSGAHRLDDVAGELDDQVRPGDVLLIVGAGDVRRVLDHHLT